MKLIISVVHDKDVHLLLDELITKGYRATKLASTGGFLKEGNTTLLIGVQESQVEEVLNLIAKICHTRQQVVSSLALTGPAEGFLPYSMEVTVGGATVFIIDVEKYYKV